MDLRAVLESLAAADAAAGQMADQLRNERHLNLRLLAADIRHRLADARAALLDAASGRVGGDAPPLPRPVPMLPPGPPRPDPPGQPEADEWLTTQEVAALLGMSDQSVRNLGKSGHLPVYRHGRRIIRYKRAEVEEYLRRQRGG